MTAIVRDRMTKRTPFSSAAVVPVQNDLYPRWCVPAPARPLAVILAALVVLGACAMPHKEVAAPQSGSRMLFDPATGGVEQFEHHALRKGRTRYRVVDTAHGPLLKAEGQVSASILLKVLEPPMSRACRDLSWSWWVERLQAGADIRHKPAHDVGASLFVAFGDPGILRDRRVPTLQYVWTNNTVPEGRVLTGPYHEDSLRTIVARSGDAAEAGPVSEQRDLFRDFEQAFGRSPESGVHAVALFTDNDDTGEPVVSYYGPISLQCDAEEN